MPIRSMKAYLYPGDEAAIKAVNSIPGMEKLLSFISKNSIERYYDMIFTSTYLKLTEKTAPKIDAMCKRACVYFGVERMPDIFLKRSYDCDLFLFGVDKPKLLVNSSMLEMLSEADLEVFLSSAMAAVRAGHGMINLLLMVMNTFGGALPVSQSVISYPIYQWKRQSYYTYDRARMLYSDDFDLTMKLIGYGEVPEDIMAQTTCEDRMRQNEEFLQLGGGAGAAKVLQTLYISKPWNASRMVELYNWVESGEYKIAKEVHEDGSL